MTVCGIRAPTAGVRGERERLRCSGRPVREGGRNCGVIEFADEFRWLTRLDAAVTTAADVNVPNGEFFGAPCLESLKTDGLARSAVSSRYIQRAGYIMLNCATLKKHSATESLGGGDRKSVV